MGLLSKISGWFDEQEERYENREKIEVYLRVCARSESPYRTAREISEATGVELKTTMSILSNLVSGGFVENETRDGETYYSHNPHQGHGAGCSCHSGGVIYPH
ncbi:MAG: hypothetical protein ACE5Z5_06840 [Candidatus Bathyarchaeia archaeon]